MTDEPTALPAAEDPVALRKQLDQANQRVIQAELRSHAIRAGILDVEGLKLLDMTSLRLDQDGNLPDGAGTIATLKRDKPWLFPRPHSSNPAVAPAPEPPKTRMAKEMSYEEWQTARARLIRGR